MSYYDDWVEPNAFFKTGLSDSSSEADRRLRRKMSGRLSRKAKAKRLYLHSVECAKKPCTCGTTARRQAYTRGEKE